MAMARRQTAARVGIDGADGNEPDSGDGDSNGCWRGLESSQEEAPLSRWQSRVGPDDQQHPKAGRKSELVGGGTTTLSG